MENCNKKSFGYDSYEPRNAKRLYALQPIEFLPAIEARNSDRSPVKIEESKR
jgi:hypothetical protein